MFLAELRAFDAVELENLVQEERFLSRSDMPSLRLESVLKAAGMGPTFYACANILPRLSREILKVRVNMGGGVVEGE